MRKNAYLRSLEILKDKRIDFFLEDDMFHIDGVVRKEGDKFFVRELTGVDHILRISGEALELLDERGKILMKHLQTSQVFDVECNRIYDLVNEPEIKDFNHYIDIDIIEFLKKTDEADVVLSKEKNSGVWRLTVMTPAKPYGIAYESDSLEELYNEQGEVMKGSWMAVYHYGEWDQLK